jgi:3-dehydroquinate synthase
MKKKMSARKSEKTYTSPNGYVKEIHLGNKTIFEAKDTEIKYRNYFVSSIFETDDTLASLCKGRQTTIILDDAIYQNYERSVRKYFKEHGIQYYLYPGKGGEHNKNLDSVFEIIDNAIKDKLDRKAVFVVIGGGTLMDVVGLAAQLYRRGIRLYIRVPSTLVGIIDAGIGVKVGVNYKGHKNLIGAFYPPYAIVSDLSFLKTLGPRQMRSGMGEMLKMAIVSDKALFEDIEEYGNKIIYNEDFEEKESIIKRAALSELRLIQRDFKENDLRREVDLGHTVSSFAEDLTDYSLLHGEAVGIDILISSHVAMQRGVLASSVFERILDVIKLLRLPVYHEALTIEKMCPAGIERAKAHKGGQLIMVIPHDIGRVDFIHDLSESELRGALQYLSSIFDVKGA